jgi:hypothetical protein
MGWGAVPIYFKFTCLAFLFTNMLGEIIYQYVQILLSSMDYDAGQIEMSQFVIKCSCFEPSHSTHGKGLLQKILHFAQRKNSLLYFLIVTAK